MVYDLLFKVSAETLLTIAADPKHLGTRIGITAVLHTWGSALTHHPHVHMIVPGGGISLDGSKWVSCWPGFFLPVHVLSRLFRRLFLEKFVAAHQAGHLSFFGDDIHLADAQSFAAFLAPLRKAEWVVYAKRPFGGPEAVLAYLSRYTHRVAIANSRLIACDERGVTFKWKDYRIEGRDRFKQMTVRPMPRRTAAATVSLCRDGGGLARRQNRLRAWAEHLDNSGKRKRTSGRAVSFLASLPRQAAGHHGKLPLLLLFVAQSGALSALQGCPRVSRSVVSE